MKKKWPRSLNHTHTPEAIAERLNHRYRGGAISDVIYGAIDGTVTTFSIVAGVSGAELSDRVVLILGISNVLSDGFSMAASNYLATKARMDERSLLTEFENDQIIANPQGETEEVRQIFKSKGFEGELLDKAVKEIVQDRRQWVQFMLSEEYGLELNMKSPLKAGGITFLAFIAFGMIPMLPYLIGSGNEFQVSTFMTGFAFFLLGALKSLWSLEPAWKSGIKTMLIGSVAAGLAYLVGVTLKDVIQ